ncbi:MAG: sulfatase [Planctomycetes bacterium]|nr:sulfatase [Planctomycetota bacterium]
MQRTRASRISPRRCGSRAALAAAALLAFPGCAPEAPPAAAVRPDVIWIVVDTLRRDRLGCYGHTRATSPELDALAREALVFERAYTSAPWTTPAVGGLLTAQAPSALGLVHERSRLPAEWTTAAELFAQAGYRTSAVVSHSFCSSLQGFDQGFEVFDETNVRGYAEATSPGVTARAVELLAREDERPLFLFVHYFDPHFAYLEHEAHPFRGPRAYAGPVRPGQRFEELERLVPSLGEPDYERLLELYDSEVAFTDAAIGKLLQALRARPRWERTVVAVTADHGEEFGERRSLGHGSTLFGEAIDVPLLLRVPGRGAERLSTPVSTLGLLPTCAALAGLADLPAQLGRDLLRAGPPEPVFVETNQGGVLRAAIDGSSKLIADLATRSSRLYHLRLDPHERADRAASHAAEVARLEELLAGWLAVATEPRFTPEEAQLDEAALERLRSLGYLGGR